MWGKKNNILKTVHLDIKGSLPEQARKPRDRGRDDFIEIRTDSPVCILDSLVGRAVPREAAYILFSHPTGKTFNSGKHLMLMESGDKYMVLVQVEEAQPTVFLQSTQALSL